MTFNPGSQLDPGQIIRPSRHGRAAASPSVAAARSAWSCSRLHASRRQPERPRSAPRTGRRDRPGELRARHRLQDRRRTPMPATTAGSSATSTASRSTGPTPFSASGKQYQPVDTVLFTRRDAQRLRHRERRRAARSTARSTSWSTSTSASSTSCGASSARRAARSPRAMSSPTNTATTSRTFSAPCRPMAAADRRRGPIRPDRAPGRLLRRRLGQPRVVDRLSSRRSPTPRSPTRSTPPRRSVTTGSRRRRGPGEPGFVDARLVGPAPEMVHDRIPDRRPGCLRHVQRRPERPGYGEGGGAGIDDHSLVVADQPRGGRANPALHVGLQPNAHRERWLVTPGDRADRTAVNSAQQPLALQQLQVPPDGHLRDTGQGGQGRDAHPPLDLKRLHNALMALLLHMHVFD